MVTQILLWMTTLLYFGYEALLLFTAIFFFFGSTDSACLCPTCLLARLPFQETTEPNRYDKCFWFSIQRHRRMRGRREACRQGKLGIKGRTRHASSRFTQRRARAFGRLLSNEDGGSIAWTSSICAQRILHLTKRLSSVCRA